MLKYTEEHEWLRLEGDIATVGITAHATELLGDVVFVQLPEVGATLAKGDDAAVVESVKAASDVFAPLALHRVGAQSDLVQDLSCPLEACAGMPLTGHCVQKRQRDILQRTGARQ